MDELERELLKFALLVEVDGEDLETMQRTPVANEFLRLRSELRRRALSKEMPGWKEDLLNRKRLSQEAREHYMELLRKLRSVIGEDALNDVLREV